jgi:anti-sigma B factor antagonist
VDKPSILDQLHTEQKEPMNHEGHEVSRRLSFQWFPSCDFVSFAVKPGLERACIACAPAIGFSNAAQGEAIPGDEMNLTMETRVAEDVTIISCHGRILFGEEAAALRQELKRVLSSSHKVILNLAGVSYIDSGGLGTLVGVYSSARSAGADIKLTGIGQRMHDVLQVTKLVTVFEAYDNEHQAMAAFVRKTA